MTQKHKKVKQKGVIMQNAYYQFDSSVAETYIWNKDEGFVRVAKNICKKAVYLPKCVTDYLYLKGETVIEDFNPSYDETVDHFLETCIPSFNLFVKIQHCPDEKISKIILG